MAIRDLQDFLRERALAYDSNLDASPGSTFDVQVIQPLVRRLGTDPFTVDVSTFIYTRLSQAFPDMSIQEGDALVDLMVKPLTLLFDPLVRENTRVKQNLSLQDPSSMTTEEAEALGANFFTARNRGQLARGPGRILFQSAQNASVSPANFFNAKGDLHFFPTETQSISTQEMLLNVTADGLYYFDVNLIAESAGSQYKIGPGELTSVANVPAAVRVTNLRRFEFGEDEENAQEFISRVQRELGERSLVTLRGIAAKIAASFPETKRLNVVGFNDPEMRRDIIQGGGLGAIVTSGTTGGVIPDGEGEVLSRRLTQSDVDFTTIFGFIGETTDWVLTLFGAYADAPVVRDLTVRAVLSAAELDVEEQVLQLSLATYGRLYWTLRRRELTLSAIPGGILFPNTPVGELVIPQDTVHVGGMYDVYVKGSDLQQDSFVINVLTDDDPLLSGLHATRTVVGADTGFVLTDYGSGSFDNSLTDKLAEAASRGYTLQIQDGVNAGNYRILGYFITLSSTIFLQVDPAPANVDTAGHRWRLFDVINVDLLDPKETRVEGFDLSTLRSSDVVSVPAGTNFLELGVSQGDILVITAGFSAGSYTIVADPLTATTLQIDTHLTATASNLSYSIHRPNVGGALTPPFVRITQVELLDTSGQPLGTMVPYAKPVDIQSRAFQNPSRGLKHDFRDTTLGLVTRAISTNFGNAANATLDVYMEGVGTQTLQIPTVNATLATALAELNTSFEVNFGLSGAVVQVGIDRLGFRPFGTNGFMAVTGGTARAALFGDTQLRTTGDIRIYRNNVEVDWSTLNPAVDASLGMDVLQVLEGHSVGYYPSPFTFSYARSTWSSAANSKALLVGALDDDTYLPVRTFSPEQSRRVQVGARSLGSVRMYFVEPTSVEVYPTTTFSVDLGANGTVRFMPDPTLEVQQIPALPSNVTPVDGSCVIGTSVLTSAQDFLLAGVQVGSHLKIKSHPIQGTIVLSDPVLNLGGKTFVFSLDGEADITVTFVRDDYTLPINAVSRAGVVAQINAAARVDIAYTTVTNNLRFTTTKDLVIRGSGTANASILYTVYGTSPIEYFGPEDQSNLSPLAGTYVVESVAQHALTVASSGGPAFATPAPFTGGAVTEQTFEVYRVGTQRISSSQMVENQAEAGLYYFDVELVSEGTGDLWNIDAGLQLTVEGYRSDGWYLTTDDEALTFSEVERPKLVISRSILESGVDDTPANATQLTGENIQITYERADLVSGVQGFLSAETERVVCASPLSKYLVPHFVRFDLAYSGGSKESTVLDLIQEYIASLAPTDTLDASDLQKLVTGTGSTYVQNPLNLLALVHGTDRSIWAQRSQDRLSTGRLSAFLSDRIVLTRDVAG